MSKRAHRALVNAPRAVYLFFNLSLRSGDTISERLRNAAKAFRTRLKDNLYRDLISYKDRLATRTDKPHKHLLKLLI
jgi:hypothetical protein